MRIAPVNNQNVSHKAVNQKYLKKVINEYERSKPLSPIIGHELTMLNVEIAYGFISLQDGIDTFEAIKPYAQNATDYIDGSIRNLKEAIRNRALKK